jgi:hypothetical protein
MLGNGSMDNKKMKKKGRPTANNVEYFPHKCKDDKELRFIQHNYKSKGFEVFYRIQQTLGDADNHFIELSDDLQKSMFYMMMQVEPEVVDGVIDILVACNWLDKELHEKYNILWSDKFMDSVRAVYANRIRKDPNRHIPTKQDIHGYSTCRNESIVEYSREKNSKVKKSIESKDDNPLSLNEYEKLFPKKDLTFLKKYLKNSMAKHSKAMDICENEINLKKLVFKKTVTGYNKAWCSKCNKREFPDDFQLKRGSECCSVSYTNEPKNV